MMSWQQAAPKILREIAAEDHPHSGNRLGHPPHEHRSLWFIDPYGVEGIDRPIIYSLPLGSEVIINLDLMDLLRRAGKADAGDHLEEAKLDMLFDGSGWRVAGDPETMRRRLAANFASSFADSRFDHHNPYPLSMTGSQHRAMIHLTTSPRAVTEFHDAVKDALEVETLFAGTKMSRVQRNQHAERLQKLFAGRRMTTVEMQEAGAGLNLGQIRVVCRAAHAVQRGTWDEEAGEMEWTIERPSLWG